MDIYAELARVRMQNSDVTVEDFARVVEKSRFAGSLNAKAQFRKRVTVEEVLAARSVISPLTLPMCSPIGDGGSCSGGDVRPRGKAPGSRAAGSGASLGADFGAGRW